MKLISFRIFGKTTWGAVEGKDAVDVGSILGERFGDLKSVIASAAYAAVESAAGNASHHPLSSLEWLPVIPNPEEIFCVGLNYETHRLETGRAVVGHPTIFTRFANAQIGHLENIVRPRVSTDLYYEGELALIIGKVGRYIPRDKAFEHVAGYACYNDVSVRDWQYHTMQFTPGKNFPSTGCFGPWMVTPDEMGEINKLQITTTLNGQIVQEAEFGQMIFEIPTIVEYCSSFNPLMPGDIIVTGTLGGVGIKRTPPLRMGPGDVVEVDIERIGKLRNSIIDDASENER
jgi:2-keto-4-pentenoate hydratase/2-oxohepta-3-ene-1,7-dioic acid hydratase in catechol pathway